MIFGRTGERQAIDALLAGCRAGESGTLVLSGEPGIGKTHLLGYAAGRATDLPLLRGTGIESEAELPFAGLHMLLRPALDRVDALPGPQRRALRGAFGLGVADPVDRLLTGLAVLSLLAELGPVLCLVDDAQWLDRASAEALLFAARRLHSEGVGLLFAARPGFRAPGLPTRTVAGLEPDAAAALLDAHDAGLTPAVRYRVLAEARGNPLALRELPASLATASGPTGPLPLSDRLQLAFHGQAAMLPPATRTLLLVAAADDTGDPGLILRAGALLGAGLADVAPAEHLLAEGDGTVAFRHPLVRAAVYQGAPLLDRIAAHRALAAALGDGDTDRRAWHLAAAATGPDEEVAAELARAAEHSRSRSGYAAASTGYERSARLSPDRAARADRLLLAAESAVESGDLDRAGTLADEAVRDVDPRAARTRLTLLQGTVAFWRGEFRAAHALLIAGFEACRDTGPGEGTRMLVQAFHTGWYTDEAAVLDVVRRMATAPATPVTRLLTAAVSPWTGLPVPVDEALDAALLSAAGEPRDLVMVLGIALALGRDDLTAEHAGALAVAGRAQGGFGFLPTALFFQAEAELFAGRHAEAAAAAHEAVQIAADTGQRQWLSQVNGLLAYLAAIRGDEEACLGYAAAARSAEAGGPWTEWALGMLDLGLGRVEAALHRFEGLATGPLAFHVSATRCVPDLVEAAVRLGRPERAVAPLARFEAWAGHTGQPWALALALRCRALLTGEEADHDAAHEAARPVMDPTGQRPERPFERARTDLLYGEWLRRGRRRAEARGPLRTAMEIFEQLGAEPWATRARAELGATGDAAPAPRSGPLAVLTPQELAIVHLAAQGLSNRDIAARLFLSPRTVGHHLYKAYPKLGILSRGELAKLVA
ncbi:transcriptional regulator [Longispora fulva]|uniref:DNA-binding CsgD family transcriptional regulator n=1 Tax=Longispora fulva TaxID=619741 RepID=A0A8J7GN04_9ACTN|nr:LuxR family transcriptional regulator [Longispora fulva]MBG6139913.1 DNA-binding CsgD family transcriptional regulator [Longispora fulva]GIG57703.1 transcriptional regulator [Longispora fulva]